MHGGGGRVAEAAVLHKGPTPLALLPAGVPSHQQAEAVHLGEAGCFHAPTVMPKVTSADGLYPETVPGAEPVEGALARTQAVFEFRANGVSDTVKYVWGLDRTPPSEPTDETPVKGGSVKQKITPLTPGPHTLYVRAYDVGGNPGPVYPYRFYVKSPGVTDKPGDLNGDGQPDMLAVDGSANLRLYGGTGNGAVATMVPLSSGGGWNGARMTHRGDWDEDLYEDLVTLRGGKLWFYPNDGQGEFTDDTRQEVEILGESETGGVTSTADIDQIVSVGNITNYSEADYPDFVGSSGTNSGSCRGTSARLSNRAI
ncbi:putative ATP/GTP-binding protein [Streptomyces azureus]|uniref:Putative ATP/GTP-binding protein n=2 Tax=Streptomyces azureus TaxID=146537 RepID=A0A0K8PVL0_STRAJ|nr:putative ATP/GTP-binding protein [Streptomyces azureus]